MTLKTTKAGKKSQSNKSANVKNLHQATDEMIAEAAYFKAQARGFTPGFEDVDWFEAEQEINAKSDYIK